MTMDLKIPLTKLYEKTSGRGSRYFVGRLGNARVVMFRDEQAEGADPVWQIFLSDGPQGQPQGRRPSDPPAQARQRPQEPALAPSPSPRQGGTPQRTRRASRRPQQAAPEWRNWQAPIDDLNDPLPPDMQ